MTKKLQLLNLFVLALTIFIVTAKVSFATPSGISGRTYKGSSAGCTCHTSAVTTGVQLVIAGPATLTPGATGNYTATMTYSSLTKAGIDIAASSGTLVATDTRTKLLSGDVVQKAAVAGTGSIVWTFSYTAPALPGTQTLYAAGCAKYSNWNHAANFTVTVSQPAGTLSLTSPSGGQNWVAGTMQNITWNATGSTNVKIEYSINGGTSWISIIASTPSAAGSYAWTVPNTPSVNCKVRVTDVDNPALTAASSAVFSISSPTAAGSSPVVPAGFELKQNYPNPFNPSTTVSYSLAEAGYVRLTVYNVLGKAVASPVNGFKAAGVHQVIFNASGLQSGVYYYELRSGTMTLTKRMVLLK